MENNINPNDDNNHQPHREPRLDPYAYMNQHPPYAYYNQQPQRELGTAEMPQNFARMAHQNKNGTYNGQGGFMRSAGDLARIPIHGQDDFLRGTQHLVQMPAPNMHNDGLLRGNAELEAAAVLQGMPQQPNNNVYN